MCYGFMVTCFLIGKRKFSKLLGSENILGNILQNFLSENYSREFYNFTSLILFPYIVMVYFCLAIN